MRLCPHLRCELFLFFRFQTGSEYRFHASGWERRLHHNSIKMIKHPVERGWVPAPPGCDGWKLQILTSQMSGEPGKKRHDGGRLDHTTSQSICNFYVSCHNGLDQTWYTEKRMVYSPDQALAPVVRFSSCNFSRSLKLSLV